jgi:2'-5' RNA ligase
MRLFIAFPLKDTLKSSLHKIAYPLQNIMKATWVAPQNYHITIQFLGEVDSKMVPVIDKKLTEIQSVFIPFICHFSTISYFPYPNRPKALIVSIIKNPSMELLAQKIQSKMKEIDFIPNSPFIPHMTLARFKNNFGIGPLIPGLVPINKSQEISRFALIQSILSSDGPTYQDLKTYSIEKGS